MVTYLSEQDEDEPEQYYGSLHVYFKKNTWNTKVDGVIYSDSLFLHELKEYLRSYISRDALEGLDYSEQGRQTRDYVDFDVGNKFVKEWYDVVKPAEFSSTVNKMNIPIHFLSQNSC